MEDLYKHFLPSVSVTYHQAASRQMTFNRSLHACWCLDVRLAGSSLRNEGRLEVYYGGVWGTVCDKRFDYIDAGVVCNSLGFGLVSVSCHSLCYKWRHTQFDMFCLGS